MEKISVKIDLGKYKYVDLSLDKAIEFIEKAIELHGPTQDLEETLRYLRNFDEFYRYMKKKFKDFITPPKSSKELVEGRVFIHRLKLYMDGVSKRVLLVIDRRVGSDVVKQVLSMIGYTEGVFEKEPF